MPKAIKCALLVVLVVTLGLVGYLEAQKLGTGKRERIYPFTLKLMPPYSGRVDLIFHSGRGQTYVEFTLHNGGKSIKFLPYEPWVVTYIQGERGTVPLVMEDLDKFDRPSDSALVLVPPNSDFSWTIPITSRRSEHIGPGRLFIEAGREAYDSEGKTPFSPTLSQMSLWHTNSVPIQTELTLAR